MSRHRGEPPPRYQPRYGRFVVLGVSLTTTAVALLGGVGVLPSAADEDAPAAGSVVAPDVANPVDRDDAPDARRAASPIDEAADEPEPSEQPEPSEEPATGLTVEEPVDTDEPEPPLPADSGEGKRVVFSEAEQRVWLVGSADRVRDTYLVSGSLTDNLQPGTYQVYSRSEDAVGIDDSGTMKWFVRFTQGPTGAAIGFHTIPVDEGERVQTVDDLGTPQSHGCIRQATPDALELWEFAPLGTTVVVV